MLQRKALVTGAGGFLGRMITAEFARAGYGVVGVDQGHGEADSDASAWHVVSLPDERLVEILAEENPAIVAHAAGPASVQSSVADPLADFEGSVRMTAHVFDSIRKAGIDCRVVLLSSAAVYGNPSALPVAEDARVQPISPYGFHKQMVEAQAREYHQVYDVPACSLRVFSAYGEGLRRQLLWDVCEKVGSGEVRLFGTGSESRDFVHASDVAQAVRIAAEHGALAGETYNVASGVETTVREVAETIVGILAPGTPITFSGKGRPGDPGRWRADISRITALGYEPSVGLSEGIAGYCVWYAGLSRGTES